MTPTQAQSYIQTKHQGQIPTEAMQLGVPDPQSTSPLRDMLDRTVDYARFTSEHVDRISSRLEPVRLDDNLETPPIANIKPELPQLSLIENKVKEIEMSLSYINHVLENIEKTLRI